MPYPENKEFQFLLDKVKDAIAQKLPVCMYRKPNQNEVKAIFQNSDELFTTTDFEDSGFVFAPFDLKNNAVLIKSDRIESVSYKSSNGKKASIGLEPTGTAKANYLDLVQKGLNAIAKGGIQKVVLSRKIEVNHQVSAERIITRILDAYPSAFCYLFFHPRVGFWCGASPETFLHVEKNRLKTMSLAGTLPYQPDAEPRWGEKELEEQAIVTRFITDRLSKEAEALDIKDLKSVKAGLLWHLKTEIWATLSSNASLKNSIGLLHPTPAVCGLPVELSKEFILEHEGYNRKYYTGFLGELGMGESNVTALYVNLRCMELTQSGASVFVGGGITADSIPENEWEEIQNKSKTMLSLL
ncbi:MAG: chorismate-binding protein [Bacteroidota bacterium]